jgi:hypothetical protein
MFHKARKLSIVELDYLKLHKDDPITQLCIALSNTKSQIKLALSTLNPSKKSNKKVLPGNKPFRSKIGKRKDLNNLFVRSGWEADQLRFFNYKKEELGIARVDYEPTDFTFWQFGVKRGTVSYTPDFKITYVDGSYIWCECKGGFLKPSDKTRIRRFQKYYPEEAKLLTAITPGPNTKTALFFKGLNVKILYYFPDLKKQYRDIIPFWESR